MMRTCVMKHQEKKKVFSLYYDYDAFIDYYMLRLVHREMFNNKKYQVLIDS